MTKPLVSILDDEPEIRTLLSDVLQEAGFDTMSFGRASAFEAALAKRTPDVCLVDLSLPDTDGLTLVHRLALEQGAVVIIISGRAQVQDRVTGLELGADDYISKPFDPAEVVARIRARLRSTRPASRASNTARFKNWTAHFDRYMLEDEGGLETPFGAAGESFDRAMDVRVSRLRTKLREDPKNPQLIKTIYGAGYIFLGDVAWV